MKQSALSVNDWPHKKNSQEPPKQRLAKKINKNVLLQDIPTYASCLNDKGTLLLSGFYASDIEDIKRVCASVQLEYTSHLEKENWVAVKFSKQ